MPAHPEFVSGAFSDKIYGSDGRVHYLLFFESDEAYRGSGPFRNTKIFRTENGFHAIGDYVTDARGKGVWFSIWKALYPGSDYILNNENALAPRSGAELDFIYSLLARHGVQDGSFRVVKYYTDKNVFRFWERDQYNGDKK